MIFAPLAVAAAILSTSVSAKSSVLRGPTVEVTPGESTRENHTPAGYPLSSSTGCDKCIGIDACIGGVDKSKIGCGSCMDYFSCQDSNSKIGAGSCIDDLSCPGSSATIGDGSCLKSKSCSFSSATIGDRSCAGGKSCERATGTIEDDSCLNDGACSRSSGTIGYGSCLLNESCLGSSGYIGDGSCLGYNSCEQTSGLILDGSCKGHASCEKSSAWVGLNSCNGLWSCSGATGFIAHNSCNEVDECRDKHHTCMAASTGFTKVQKLLGVVTGSEIRELQHLVVGDTIMGVNEHKTEVDDCEVVSVSTQGNGTVFGNYTSDHYILSEDTNNTVAHGEDGEEKYVEVFQVLSSCPLNVDESGKKTSFSICGGVLYDGGPMPWSDYLKIHGIMFKLVKETGVRDLSAFHNLDDATQRLSGLCSSGLTCAKEGDCGEFEAKMMDLIQKDLVPDARKKVYAAFRHLGDASKEGSISFMISKGLSGAIASE